MSIRFNHFSFLLGFTTKMKDGSVDLEKEKTIKKHINQFYVKQHKKNWSINRKSEKV